MAKINTVIVFVEVVNFLPNTNCQNILLPIQLCNSVSFCLEWIYCLKIIWYLQKETLENKLRADHMFNKTSSDQF